MQYNTFIQNGIEAVRRRAMAEARFYFTEAIFANPRSGEAWFWLSMSVSELGEKLFCLNTALFHASDHESSIQALKLIPHGTIPKPLFLLNTYGVVLPRCAVNQCDKQVVHEHRRYCNHHEPQPLVDSRSAKQLHTEQLPIQHHEEPSHLPFPTLYHTADGHAVRSKSEALIDNWLYAAGIEHIYERRLPFVERVYYCDFYLPVADVYIEFWGLDDPQYRKRQRDKQRLYDLYQLRLIELTDIDVRNLDVSLLPSLTSFGVYRQR